MQNNWFRIKSALHYALKARHRKGFGIHSPFVFSTLNEVVYVRDAYYCYDEIERLRRQLLADSTPLQLKGCGTAKAKNTCVKDVAIGSGEPASYAQLLFRLALSNCSKTIFELGTSLGVTTLYLSSVAKQGSVFTFEQESALAEEAKKNFQKLHRHNINIIEGNLDETLPKQLEQVEQLDFVFFDANHTKEATLRYYEWCLQKTHKHTIFVFDDIHWSPGMEEAWNEIIARKEICVSMDLFRMGICWFDNEIPKQNLIVAYN